MCKERRECPHLFGANGSVWFKSSPETVMIIKHSSKIRLVGIPGVMLQPGVGYGNFLFYLFSFLRLADNLPDCCLHWDMEAVCCQPAFVCLFCFALYGKQSCLHLHFYRISPNWRIRGGKPSCCPEWNILILWLSGRHSRVIVHTNITRFKSHYKPFMSIQLWLFGFQNTKCDCVCLADELLWIVMEYCRGGDLLQRIKQQKSNQFSVDNVRPDFLHSWSQLPFPTCVSLGF